jgi:hypothetical protein
MWVERLAKYFSTEPLKAINFGTTQHYIFSTLSIVGFYSKKLFS